MFTCLWDAFILFLLINLFIYVIHYLFIYFSRLLIYYYYLHILNLNNYLILSIYFLNIFQSLNVVIIYFAETTHHFPVNILLEIFFYN